MELCTRKTKYLFGPSPVIFTLRGKYVNTQQEETVRVFGAVSIYCGYFDYLIHVTSSGVLLHILFLK
jgi:hypothetical protein